MRVSSSAASTSGTPRTFFDPSSTPMTTIPPPVFATATRHLRMLSGDDKSRLYSEGLPFVALQQFDQPHNSAFYSEAFLLARLPSTLTVNDKVADKKGRVMLFTTPSDRAKTVSQKLSALELLGLGLSEKQIPQIVENTKKCGELMEPLEPDGIRPRQVRYQAALRPDRLNCSSGRSCIRRWVADPL